MLWYSCATGTVALVIFMCCLLSLEPITILVFAEIDVMTLHLTVTSGTEIACLLNYLSIVLQKSIKYNSKYLN